MHFFSTVHTPSWSLWPCGRWFCWQISSLNSDWSICGRAGSSLGVCTPLSTATVWWGLPLCSFIFCAVASVMKTQPVLCSFNKHWLFIKSTPLCLKWMHFMHLTKITLFFFLVFRLFVSFLFSLPSHWTSFV